jgi:hypothetical protein
MNMNYNADEYELQLISHHRDLMHHIALLHKSDGTASEQRPSQEAPSPATALYKKLKKLQATLRWIHPAYNSATIEYAEAEAQARQPAHLAFHDPDECIAIGNIIASDIYDAARIRRNAWRSLPSHCRDLWTDILNKIAVCSLPDDVKVACLICAPAILLDKHCTAKHEALLTHLMHLASSTQNVLTCITQFIQRPLSTHPAIQSQELNVRKIKALLSMGAERKALELASPSSHVDISPTVCADLQKLFPKQKVAWAPRPLNSTPPTFFSNEDLRFQTVCKLARGSAPGLDGWTRELLLPLLFSPSVARDLMVGIINKLAANTLSPEEREFLNTGIMLALRKPNSNKLRPIVIGSTLVKLAWKAMIKVVCNAALLSQHQLIGRRPCETAIHRAVKELRNGNTLLSFDASNAFNEICRSAIHDKLLKHSALHPALTLFYATYGGPSQAIAGDQTITIEEGVKQGCAAGPLLFLLGIADPITTVATDNACTVRGVADDILLSSPAAQVLDAASKQLENLLAPIGIKLNRQKSVACGPCAHELPFPKVTQFDYLGAIICETPTTQVSLQQLRPKYACRRSAVDILLKHADAFSKQEIFLLMRYVNITLSYFMANTEPSTTVELRKEHRQWCVRTLSQLLSLPPSQRMSEAQFHQASLAELDGGLNVVDWVTVAEKAHHHTKYFSLAPPMSNANPNPQPAQSIFQLVAQIQEKQADSLCTPPISVSSSTKSNSQPSSQQSHHHYSHAFRNTLRDGDGRIRWPSIRPDVKLLRLDDAQWLSAMRLLLGISLEVPICDNKNYTVINDHALACSFCAGHHWKLRHQRILFALQRELRQAGILMSTTDYMLSQKLKGDSGPDGLIYGKKKTIAIDVTVAHQPSAERQQRTYQSTAHKKKKYKDLCEANNWDLAPLVFSSFGHPTSQTVKWLRTFASISKTPGTFRKLMHVCSIAVVRGNHDIISLLTTAPTSPSHPA